MKQVDAIFTADWHIREDQPTCRTDNFEETQWRKIKYISDLQKKYNCPVIHSGDLFDFWKPSPALISKCIDCLPNNFCTIYGNHDLPQHSIQLAYKSGIYCLQKAGALEILDLGHWGRDIDNVEPINIGGNAIFVQHIMTYVGKIPYPGCTAPKSTALLRKYGWADVIVTGHNHKPFVEDYEGRIIVNPGSITRQTVADTYKPRVYLYTGADNSVEPHYLPIDENVISREHIDIVNERDTRIDAFISTLEEDWEAALDFNKNLELFFEKNSIRQSVKQIIYKSVQ